MTHKFLETPKKNSILIPLQAFFILKCETQKNHNEQIYFFNINIIPKMLCLPVNTALSETFNLHLMKYIKILIGGSQGDVYEK